MPATGLATAPDLAIEGPPAWIAAAALAVVLPTLLALDVPPSATFLNQAAALFGWGVFALLLAALPGLAADPLRRGGPAPLLAALTLLALAALAGPLWAGLPGKNRAASSGHQQIQR